jgi:methylated-DNA-protein-cysteine methyltransferase-like protein
MDFGDGFHGLSPFPERFLFILMKPSLEIIDLSQMASPRFLWTLPWPVGQDITRKVISSMRQYFHRGLRHTSCYDQIYDVVRLIPPGRVATYGQIAKIVGRCTARMIGYAMAALPSNADVPWQRVINHKGEISRRARGDGSPRQRKLLEAEGIKFDERGRVDLKKVRWPEPDSRHTRRLKFREGQRSEGPEF